MSYEHRHAASTRVRTRAHAHLAVHFHAVHPAVPEVGVHLVVYSRRVRQHAHACERIIHQSLSVTN